jgi:hypothetical protein
MPDMAGKPKSRSVAKPHKSRPKPRAKARVKAPRTSPSQPRARAESEDDLGLVDFDIAILNPDGTYDIDALEVIPSPSFTERDAVKCYREEHREVLDPQALLAVVIRE